MIEEKLIEAIAERTEKTGLSESVLMDLRRQYPDLHFTYCMDDDIGNAKPIVSRSKFNIYLVDSREHCLRLTNDPAIATGIVLAEVIED